MIKHFCDRCTEEMKTYHVVMISGNLFRNWHLCDWCTDRVRELVEGEENKKHG